MRTLRPPWPWAALALLVAASTALRAWAARDVAVPWIAPDEMIYGLTGLDLWHHGSLEILGGPTPYYSFLFPAFAGVPLSLGSLAFGYGALKIVQALVMSLAAVPVYLWGRSLVSRPWALVAAGLTLAAPGLAYSGLVMTEVLFYPLLTLAAWAMARALAEPALRSQGFFVLAAVAAGATGLQALVLVPAFATAIGVQAWIERSREPLRRSWPALAALTALAGGWLLYRVASGGALLGGYAGVTGASYGAGGAAKYVAFHAGSLLIATGIFPVCALACLLSQAVLGGEASSRARAYVATASALAFWFVLEVGVFASQHVGRLAERDLLALSPTLFVGLVLWLERGAPRRFALAAGVALLAAAALEALPVGRLVSNEAAPDALTLVPLLELVRHTSKGTMELVYYVTAGVAVAAFALLPGRALRAVPVLLAAAGIAASVAVSGYIADHARLAQTSFLGPDRRWIDHIAPDPVAYLYGGERDWTGVWYTLFWNHRVDRVYDLGHEQVPGPVPQAHLDADPDDGRLVSLVRPPGDLRFAVAPASITLDGEPVAQLLDSTLLTTLKLWRLEPPLRIVSSATGVLPNGDINGATAAELTGYGCRGGGTFLVTLLIKAVPVDIALSRDGEPWRTLHFGAAPADGAWRGRIPAAPSESGVCTLGVSPTGLTGSTVFTFQPG